MSAVELEELRWMPGIADCDLMMYLRAARSMAAFAGMCDGGSAEDGCLAASRDDTTINALDVLHKSNYDTGKALQALVKNPIPKGIEKKWTDDEQKRFVKGLRQYGKNFFKIRRELLSQKETADLVEFYYLWKKTPQAATTRPHRRHRRQSIRRISRATTSPPGTATSKSPASSSLIEMSSGSDDEESEDDTAAPREPVSDSTCHHCCTTTSKDWQHIGKERTLLCTECRLFYKKHGEFRPLNESKDNTVSVPQSPVLFKAKKEEEENASVNGKHVMRTRRSKELNSKILIAAKANSKSSEQSSPERTTEDANNKSESKELEPVVAEVSASKKAETSPKVKKRSREDKTEGEVDETDKAVVDAKRKKANGDSSREPSSPSESVTTESSSIVSNEENNEPNETEGSEEAESANVADSVVTSAAEVASNISPAAEEKEIAKVEKVEEKEIVANTAVPSEIPTEETQVNESSVHKPPIPADNPEGPNPVSRVPPVPPLITPKLEPPSSPSASEFPGFTENIPSATSDSFNTANTSVPSVQTLQASPPVRIKEEVQSAFVKSPTPPSDVLQRETVAFPFITPPTTQPLPPHMSSHQISSPSLNQMPSEGSRNSEERIKQSSSVDEFRSKSPKERRSVSPHRNRNSSGLRPPPAHMHGSQMSSLSNEPPIFPPAYTIAPTPTEQRLPPASSTSSSSHHHHHHPIPGMPPHPSLPSHPGLPSPMLSPGGMPPYLAPPWSPYASRSMPSHPLGFPVPGMPSSQLSANPLSSPHLSLPKAKSPVTPQSSSNRMSPASNSHYSSSSHSRHDNKYDSHHGHSHRSDRDRDRERDSNRNEREHIMPVEEEEVEQQPIIARGPSPEPKIEDSECHRSQSAIFLRHWNRGDFNSCARTDLTFKPVPDSQLARKREERARKAAEKEREEQKKAAAEKAISGDMKVGMLGHGIDGGHHLSLLDRHTPRNYQDTPALRQLSEYARPHAAFSPVFPHSLPGSTPGLPMGLGLPGSGPGIDPLLHYQMAAGMYGVHGARERLEAEEREKRERMHLMEKQQQLKEFEMKSRLASHGAATPVPTTIGGFEPPWLEFQRRYVAATSMASAPPTSAAGGAPSLPPPFAFYPPGERSAQETMHNLTMERMHSERLALAGTDPLVRLQMAGITPELALHSHAHSHAHAHQHTHLHVHPGHDPMSAAAAAAAAAAIGLPPPAHSNPPEANVHPNHPLLPPNAFTPRPGLMPRNDLSAANLFRPPFDEAQLAHQLSAQAMQQEHIQRQLFYERERMAALHAAASGVPHPSPLLQQAEADFLRQQQQREREVKLRSLEEAARGGRPPLS